MLGKLLKQEFKAMGRILMPLYAVAILMSIVTSIFMATGSDNPFNSLNLHGIITLIAVIIFFILITATVVLSYIMAIYRFRKNLLTNEGYIMNTLPVSAGQHIFAKVFTAVIFEILSIITAVIAYLIFFLPIMGISISSILSGLGEVYYRFLQTAYKGMIINILLEVSVLAIIGFMSFNVTIYAAMSIGHSSNNHKILKSIGAYMVFYVIEQFASFIFINIIVFGTSLNGMQYKLSSAQTGIQALNTLMISSIVYETVFLIAYVLITRYFLKNRLNL